MKRKLKFLRVRAETALLPSDAKNLFQKAALTAETAAAAALFTQLQTEI